MALVTGTPHHRMTCANCESSSLLFRSMEPFRDVFPRYMVFCTGCESEWDVFSTRSRPGDMIDMYQFVRHLVGRLADDADGLAFKK